METFANRLLEALQIRGMSAAELSRRTNTPESVISQYKSGQYEPKQKRLDMFSKVLRVSIPWLMGYDVPMEQTQPLPDNIIPALHMKKVPLLGAIACGEPILAAENIDDYINMPEEVDGTFALRCKGDSMINARIFNGDIVLIRQQSDVDDGQIAAVLIGNEATLKRVKKLPNKIVLSPCNPLYDDLIYTNEQLEEIRILGKAVYFLSTVR